jgi:hypothetical protein
LLRNFGYLLLGHAFANFAAAGNVAHQLGEKCDLSVAEVLLQFGLKSGIAPDSVDRQRPCLVGIVIGRLQRAPKLIELTQAPPPCW